MCRSQTQKNNLQPGDEWIQNLDLRAFAADIKALGNKLEKQQGQEDVDHLNKMIAWSNACAFVGLITMGYFPMNFWTAFALSTWTLTRWTMIAHHVCHGGYDKCHPNKKRWNRFVFALGSPWRRICDWLDWMLPEAWNVEHNNRHHYCLSEIDDPDLLENNVKSLREWEGPMIMKYIVVLLNMMTWKWQYYAPNTYKELKLAQYRKEGKKVPKNAEDAVTVKTLLTEGTEFYTLSDFLVNVVGLYFVFHFVLLPLPYFFVGQYLGVGHEMFFNALCNLILAEFITNLHSFIVIVTNHAGNDLYRFYQHCRPFSGSFFLRQILASANFNTGSDINDFLHGFLNYQIEHHLWPNLSMRSYQKAAPLVKEICKKHNVPYVQENILKRLKKTVDIMCGTTSMKTFPAHYEAKFLELDSIVCEKK